MSMRKFVVLIVVVLVCGAFAAAQTEPRPFELPKSEVFLGYAHEYADLAGVNAGTLNTVNGNSTGLNGFAFEASHYAHNNFGVTIDVARESNHKVDSTGISYVRISYLAGLSYRLTKYELFTTSVHVLGGIDHAEFVVPESLPTKFTFINTEPAVAAGATLDGNLSHHVAIRLAQVDYVYSHHYGTNQNSFRYAGGVVMRF
jgi:hypothetical protein